jgi:clan AA aspartic protease
MGMVYADIILVNGVDRENARRNIIGQEEVKEVTARMLVDSGAYMMCINEPLQEILNLPFIETRRLAVADGTVKEFDVVGPIYVKFENRSAYCNALLLKGDAEPLLGAIPLEELDVVIHPKRQELVVNPLHPDGAVLRL